MPRMTPKQIRDRIKDLLAENEAMVKVAEEEDRELTDEETAAFDANLATVGEPSDGEKKATGLYLQLEREERFVLAKDIAAGEIAKAVDRCDPELQSRAVVRPIHYVHHRLRAYQGENAEEHAHLAGQFLAATLFRNERAAQWCHDHGVSIKFQGALSGDDNSLGGFLVPEEMERAIINLREEYGVFRRNAKITPMVSDTKSVPRRTSGLTAYFAGDNDSMTASDKAWDNVALTAKKLYALCKYSSELAEDAIVSIGDDLTDEIAYAFANKEDECGFNGDGTSTYGGIVGVLNAMNAGSIYTAASGNTAFSTLDLADFEGIIGKLPQYAVAGAKWYISRVGYYASMARLADAGSGNTAENIAAGPRTQLFLGFPVVFAQVLNSTTTAQASTELLAFGNLQQAALLGNRRGMSVMISDQRYFEYDQLAIRGTERFDINVHETGDASNAGAMLVLKTPAS